MIKGKQKRPSRICFECTHYEACQAWNIGTLVETDATHCVNYRASVGKTNYDRIISKTPEELARLFCDDYGCPIGRGYPACGQTPTDPVCTGCWLDWLKQEATDGT